MTVTTRWVLLLSALFVAVVLALRAPEPAPSSSRSDQTDAGDQGPGTSSERSPPAIGRSRRDIGPARGDPFFPEAARPRPALPPVVAVQPAPPPPAPTAPPLPFQFFGRMAGPDGNPALYITFGDRLVAIKAGEQVGEYRVERITERDVQFTYLPLGQAQSMAITP